MNENWDDEEKDEELDEKPLGLQIKLRRMDKGLSIEDLAKKLGYDVTGLWHIEKGHQQPSKVFLADLDRVLADKAEWPQNIGSATSAKKRRENQLNRLKKQLNRVKEEEERIKKAAKEKAKEKANRIKKVAKEKANRIKKVAKEKANRIKKVAKEAEKEEAKRIKKVEKGKEKLIKEEAIWLKWKEPQEVMVKKHAAIDRAKKKHGGEHLTWGDSLRTCRLEHEWTVEQMAKKINRSYSWVLKAEAGHFHPTKFALFMLSTVLKQDVNKLHGKKVLKPFRRHNESDKKFADYILACRIKKGWSGRQLGRAIGRASGYVSRIESGTRIISDQTKLDICAALGVAIKE